VGGGITRVERSELGKFDLGLRARAFPDEQQQSLHNTLLKALPGLVSGKPAVRLDYRLSKTELLFERTPPAGYRAAYEVRVIFYKVKGGSQVAGDTSVRKLRAATFAETRIKSDDILDHLDFPVPPGRYEIEVAITDLVAERISGTTIEFEVPAGPSGLIWFTDLSLGTVDTASTVPGTARAALRANPSRRYAENIPLFAAAGEIFDQRSAGSDSIYRLSFSVLSDTSRWLLSMNSAPSVPRNSIQVEE